MPTSSAPKVCISVAARAFDTPKSGSFAGGGEILRLALEDLGFRCRGPSGPAPATGLAGRHSSDREVSRCAHRGRSQPHLGLRQRELPAALPFVSVRGLESRHGAFADQLPLEFGQRREDVEHEAAGRCRGVDLRALAGENPQAHAAGRQILHRVDQVGEVPAEAVELPDDEHVVLPQGAQAVCRAAAGAGRRMRGRGRR